MKQKKATALLIALSLLLFAPSVGCERVAMVPLSITPIPMSVAVNGNIAEIDATHTQDGYILVRYLEKTYKAAKVIVKKQGGTPYIYTLRPEREYELLPVSEGNGIYSITVYENIIDNKYSPVLETTQSVRLIDEFAPFIRPNQYVDYTSDSKLTAKAFELTQNSNNTDAKIAIIYNYVAENITYDRQLAESIQSGYIPNADTVLKNGKGICFDYAALMTAMLRSQSIPAKLVVGYKGTVYHAWISAYSDKNGWMLIDPTFASDNVIDVNNYFAKYIY